MTTSTSATPLSGRVDAAVQVCTRAMGTSFLVTLMVTALMALLGWVLTGPSAAGSAGVAGLILLLVFGPGLPVIIIVSRVSPAATLLVAMMTYVLQMVVLVVIMQRLAASDWLAGQLDPVWLGATLMVIALGCTVALITVSLRARIPAFTHPSPLSPVAPPTGASQSGTGGTA
ncbi:MAG TPA: hypothetical protein PKX56_01710 [Marmoricola sp.]|nr:hypothetical protein [Marmoricola sp.]HNJ78043.1 hypothetical protein [Marmoricola sp.]HNN47350.1 hypothetical protein [Marmoricola sp.]HNO39069.1 hypothetical protein [Marmoricola sp.]